MHNYREMSEFALTRANIYKFLSMIYLREVTREVLDRARSLEFLAAVSELGAEFGRDFIEVPPEKLLEDLAVEYARLFLGPGKHLSPHESVYVGPCGKEAERGDLRSAGLGRVGLLRGDATVQVVDQIEEFGFGLPPEYNGLPDHIGVEFELMHRLARSEGQAWEAGAEGQAIDLLRKQFRFLQEHLIRWVPTFCDKVEAFAVHDFYRVIARLTRELLLADQEQLGQFFSGDDSVSRAYSTSPVVE